MDQIEELIKQRDFNTVSKLIDSILVPDIKLKRKNGEVSTPHWLREKMIDLVPEEIWKNKSSYILDPCVGKVGFVVNIIEKFYINLDIPDEEERYNHIINHIFCTDINEDNVKIVKNLFDIKNCFVADSLTYKHEQKFDLIVSNPPYNKGEHIRSGNTIYQYFTKMSLKILKPNGYLLSVHPTSWRKPCTKRSKNFGMFELMAKENQMIYLNMNNIKDGMKTFNCSTRFDYFLIQNTKNIKKTLIVDEKDKEIKIDLNLYEWLPNYHISQFLENLTNEKCVEMVKKGIYDTRTYKELSDIKDTEFCYNVINSTPKSGIKYKYSNKQREHVFVPKVIFGRCGIRIFNVINDYKGELGLTNNCISIKIENEKEGELISKFLKTDYFTEFLKSCSWSIFQMENNLFRYFTKEFYCGQFN